MPFKSKKQENYLRINNPDLHEKWVESYGHFKGAEEFGADSTYYDEGRKAAKDVFMPDLYARDSYGLMDTEYMIYYNLAPDELTNEIEANSERYFQFSWGWGEGWDEAYFDHILNVDGDNTTFVDDGEWADYGTFPKPRPLEPYAAHTVGSEWNSEAILESKDYVATGVGIVALFAVLFGVNMVNEKWGGK